MSATPVILEQPTRFQETFAGGDWPKITYAPARYRTAPTIGQKNQELQDYSLDLVGNAGLILDPWQEDYFCESLHTRPDAKWASLECGLCVSRQNGKGDVCYTTPVLTTDGWTTMGDIQVGQHVYGSGGRPTRVEARSELFLGNRCYEVEFTDGSKYVVGEDHLWTVWDPSGSNGRKVPAGKWRVLSTRQMEKSSWKNVHAKTGRNSYRYRVSCDAIVEAPEAELPIDPYIFGLWLGDGGSQKACLTAGPEDVDYMREQLLTYGYELNRETRGNDKWQPWQLHFRLGERGSRNGFPSRLRQLGVYGNKHIPDCYLTASPTQRLALLRGLMDTDGSIDDPKICANKTPQVEFSSSIPALAEDFHCLVRSLGIRVGKGTWRETKHKPNWRLLWTPTFNPFRLPRKAKRFRLPISQRHRLMSITNIREVGSVPTRCIKVEAEDGVYLVGRYFTPTHNSILEAREIVGLYADERKFPGIGARLAVHTAHEAKTAHEGFERLSLLIEGTPKLRGKLRGKPRQSEGGEVIRLVDGRRIRFRTRTSGGGRGLSGDLLVFDEAMILMQGVHEAVWPIVTARENPQIWYTGSAVDKAEPLMDQHGIVFARVRKRGIAGDPDLLYAEWSLGNPDGSDYDNPDEVPSDVASDPESWEKTNPSYGIRLSPRIISVEQRTLSTRGFARERCGVGDWPDPSRSNRVIDEEKWKDACVDETSIMMDPVCFAIDVDPNRTRAAIAVAGRNESGKNQVEIIARFRSTAKIIPTMRDLLKKHGRRCEIMVDTVGSASSLIPEFENEKMNVVEMTAGGVARGCGMFYDGVMGDDDGGVPPTLQHLGDPALNAAVAGAVKRRLGDRWAWDRKNSAVDITVLVAATNALYGYLRKRHGSPSVYSGADVLGGEDGTVAPFDDSDLPPLDEEDL